VWPSDPGGHPGREQGWLDPARAPAFRAGGPRKGFNSSYALPPIVTEVNRGRITLNQYVRWASENQAKAWGFYPRKGMLMVGSDADITIVDLNKESIIDAKVLHSNCKLTPFDGFKVKGPAVCTIVRGQVVMKDGDIVASPGHGRPVISSFGNKSSPPK
jgi:formylmethanofuran dehydrogenase subunit A